LKSIIEIIYTWKCYKKKPCVIKLTEMSFFFFLFKIIEQKGGSGLWGLVPVGRRREGKGVGG
jgi:hypothetical protein